jgi:hypothetical protein
VDFTVLQVLVTACSGIFVIGGEVELEASLDGDINVTLSVASSDLGTFLWE